jgi:outer membrane immunogenic protein
MRRIAMTAAFAALIGGGTVASAADLSYKDTPSYGAAPAAVWSGLYIGGHLGGLWSGDRDISTAKRWCHYGKDGKDCSEWKETDKVKFNEDEDDDVSFIGGVHLGYNWQRDNTVLGVEADVSFADEVDYLASLRARLGYAAGDFLIYATAGVAFAGLDEDALSVKVSSKDYSFATDDDTQVGLVVGGGIEYKLRSNWSVGLEGLYYAFGEESDVHSIVEKCDEYKITSDRDEDLWTVRARLTYHFGADEYDAPLK